MAAAFIIRKAADGQFYFILTAENNKVILTSETYRSKASALNGIQAVQQSARLEKRFQRLTSKSGKPYFVLVAANGEPIGHSETYSSNQAMKGGIAAVRRVAGRAALRDET